MNILKTVELYIFIHLHKLYGNYILIKLLKKKEMKMPIVFRGKSRQCEIRAFSRGVLGGKAEKICDGVS